MGVGNPHSKRGLISFGIGALTSAVGLLPVVLMMAAGIASTAGADTTGFGRFLARWMDFYLVKFSALYLAGLFFGLIGLFGGKTRKLYVLLGLLANTVAAVGVWLAVTLAYSIARPF